MGSVVTLKRGCLLFSQPGRDTHDYVLSVVVGDETVDAVAYLVDEGFIGVVYAGFGLAWVVDSSVLWPPIDSSMSDEEDGAEAEHPLRQAHLSSLALDIEYGAEFRFPPEPLRLRSFVDVFLSILAAPTLVHLTLTRAELSREDLVALSRAFPMLQSLQLTRVLLQTLEPIVKAFATTTNQISTLVLANISPAPPLENDDQSAHIYQSLLDALAEPGHNIRKSLRELTLDFHATEDPEYPFVTETNRNGRILRSLVAILQLRDLRLKSLRVLMHNGPLDLPPVVGHVQDRVLPDPPRICCAVLSVLRVKHCEAAEVKALVLVMVRGSIVRTITWRDYAFY